MIWMDVERSGSSVVTEAERGCEAKWDSPTAFRVLICVDLVGSWKDLGADEAE